MNRTSKKPILIYSNNKTYNEFLKKISPFISGNKLTASIQDFGEIFNCFYTDLRKDHLKKYMNYLKLYALPLIEDYKTMEKIKPKIKKLG